MKEVIQHVYIVGSKGIPAKYGGFETFVEKLTEYNKNDKIKYHVACMKENSLKSDIVANEFEYNNAHCYNIDVPSIGPAKAIYYDIVALKYAIDTAKKNEDERPVFYVLACRIGPFIKTLKKEIESIGGILYINPDGHEWLREKWSYPVRKYWKISEKMMVKYSDLMICDSKSIEKYIKKDYNNYEPKTKYIAYGTDLNVSNLTNQSLEVVEWFKEKNIREKDYYLVVGRFVPENNYEIMIQEFMKSTTKKNFVIVTNIEENKFYRKLIEKTNLASDPRIKFVGTVYNQELLKYIRENAFAYIHGHEVGGTNPSLLEAMYSTQINLLLDVGFNREVGDEAAEYWPKKSNDLCNLINKVDLFDEKKAEISDIKSKKIIEQNYNWPFIVDEYEKKFKE